MSSDIPVIQVDDKSTFGAVIGLISAFLSVAILFLRTWNNLNGRKEIHANKQLDLLEQMLSQHSQLCEYQKTANILLASRSNSSASNQSTPEKAGSAEPAHSPDVE